MANPILGQVLGAVLGQAMGRRGVPGGMGAGLGGGLGGAALGSVLGGVLGRGGMRAPMGRSLGGNRAVLMMMLLPLAMRWVQRNGGMGAVLDRFKQKGYGRQAQSWMATGANDGIDEQAVEQVVGQGELARMAQRLGVPEHEVAQAFAEIMPEMVDKLTPQGQLPAQADEVLVDGADELEQQIDKVQRESTH